MQRFNELCKPLWRYGTLQLRQFKRKELQYHQLCRERLGAGYADFRPGMRIRTCVGQTCYGRTYHIYNTEYRGTLLLRVFQGHECIGRLATLRHRNDRIILVQDWVAVTELGGVFHLNIDTT